MSILDALRVQKAQDQSVRDLAMLPQQEIIRLAQLGQIPADVAPVVINEKARIAKENANLQALLQQQGQGRAPSIIEQAMTVNAQAEAPQVPQQAPQQQTPMIQGATQTPEMAAIGVSALPTGGSFQPQNFAGGGIVAFAGEGRSDINAEDIQKQLSESGSSRRPVYSSLAEAITDAKRARSEYRTLSPEELAFAEYLKGSKPRSEEQMSEQRWLRGLEAGLGIMAGESPYALTNIAKGPQAALKGYGEDLAAQRKQQAAYMQAMAEQGRRKRLEGLEDVAAGEKLFEKALEDQYRRAVLGKSTDWQRRYEAFLPETMEQLGINDPNNPKVKAATARKVDASIGLAAEREETRRGGIDAQNRREASSFVESRLSKLANPEALKLSAFETADKKNGTNTAEAYRNRLYQEALDRLERGGKLIGPLDQGTTPKSAPKSDTKSDTKASKTSLPPQAAAQLKEGFVTTFTNGQQWTLENGKPKQVK